MQVAAFHFLNQLDLITQIRNILIVVILTITSASASIPVVLTDSIEELCIAREYVEYLEDTSRALTIDDIIRLGDTSSFFIPSTAQDLINDNIKAAYWLKFKVHNKADKSYRIELFDFNIDDITFFYQDGTGKYIQQRAGFKHPFSFRQIGHKNVSFKLPSGIEPGANIYMRFYSEKHNILEPMIRSYDKTINYALTEYILFGVFYGLMLLMIFYNLLYFISLRRIYYFYYVLYACGILVYLMSSNGTGFQYVWHNFPAINDYIGETGLFIGTLAMLLFTNSFLKLKSVDEKLFKILAGAFLLRILIYAGQLIYPHYHLFEFFDLIYVQGVFIVAVILHRRSVPSAKWLVLAYSIVNITFLITLLEQTSVIPSAILTVYSMKLGIILQFIFLSIGIAETVKEAYREKNEAQANLIVEYQKNEALKEKVNRELEQKVRERTRELDNANEELKKKAQENYNMSVALDLANNELKKYLNTFAKTSVMKTHLDFEDFKKAYPDEMSCIKYLRELKEKVGFICIKCGNNKSIKGKAKFDIRCSKCNYNESLTANTIFHRIKFPLQKAFYMLYIVSQKKDSITAVQLAKTLELQSTTCQNFKNKILERLQKSGKNINKKDLSWDYIIQDKEKALTIPSESNITAE